MFSINYTRTKTKAILFQQKRLIATLRVHLRTILIPDYAESYSNYSIHTWKQILD